VVVVGFPTAGGGGGGAAAAGFAEALVAVAVVVWDATVAVAEGGTVVVVPMGVGTLEDDDAGVTELLVWDATGANFIVVEVEVWFAVGSEAVV
jgi:hypothetical protein